MIKTVKKLNLDGNFSNTYLLTLQNDKQLYVPKAEDNTDYQNILAWVAEGNTIAEAD
jgi:hypothetical protein|tara:strand:- start:4 stop:174 length:171 start_codon:yes stop_codon:yes gene_type:complete